MGMKTFREVNWVGVSFSVDAVYPFDERCGTRAQPKGRGKLVATGSNKFI